MSKRIQITNGTICGCAELSPKIVSNMLRTGDAEIDWDALIAEHPGDGVTKANLRFFREAYLAAAQDMLTTRAVESFPFKIRLTYSAKMHSPARAGGVVKDSSPTPALATVQEEALYSGSRREGSPVTGTVYALRKLRHGKFLNWSEKDTFPTRRFNPDRIATPLFASARAYELSRGAAARL